MKLYATWALSIPREKEKNCMIKPWLFPFLSPQKDILA